MVGQRKAEIGTTCPSAEEMAPPFYTTLLLLTPPSVVWLKMALAANTDDCIFVD